MKPCQPQAVLLVAIWCLLPKLDLCACSVVGGYICPSNYELVKETEAIVLAKAVTFEKKADFGQGMSFGIFKFKVLERVKGDVKVDLVSVEGDNDVRTWGDPIDFSFTKPDHGPCNPTDYVLNCNYMLFLTNWKGGWTVGGPPFTRVNVLVEGTNAPWTQAVRQYARIAKLNEYDKEKAALRTLRSRAVANDPDCPKALVHDIDAHFNKPTPAKSYLDLFAIYDRTEDLETREFVLWACARGQKLEAMDFFESLLKSQEWLKYIYPVCSYVSQVKLAGFHDTFATALETNRNEHERRSMLGALIGSARSSEQALMQKVLESVTKEESVLLGDWFVKHPSQAAITQLTKLAGKDYFENHELTLALAGMGDSNVVNWARESVSQPSENDWLGYYVFARSPLPAADVLARQVIQRGDSDGLVSLIQGYQDSPRADRLDRIRDTIALKTKSRKLIFWLRRTLGQWAYNGDLQAGLLLSLLPDVESE